MPSFIHLSDIHFMLFTGDNYDTNADLRKELLNDIKINAKLKLSDIAGVLICGDIACRGKLVEYQHASKFLDELCDILEISPAAVYCVPGNHDVDQTVLKDRFTIKVVQDGLSQLDTWQSIDTTLANIGRDQKYGKLLCDPIECYNNEFAGKYGCSIGFDLPEWAANFPLNKNYKLNIIGINSTIVSNWEDRQPNKKMMLGQFQIPSRMDRVIYLSLCHHPPELWKDNNDYLKTKMDKRVHVQLYGHKHVHGVQEKETTIIVNSGATQPPTGDKVWCPRYNWLNIDVVEKDGKEYLAVQVFSRIYNGDCFLADLLVSKLGEGTTYHICLKEDAEQSLESDDLSISEKKFFVVNQTVGKVDYKSLIFSFMNLSPLKRKELLVKYKLEKEGEERMKHFMLIDQYIKRAQENDTINLLWEDLKK